MLLGFVVLAGSTSNMEQSYCTLFVWEGGVKANYRISPLHSQKTAAGLDWIGMECWPDLDLYGKNNCIASLSHQGQASKIMRLALKP